MPPFFRAPIFALALAAVSAGGCAGPAIPSDIAAATALERAGAQDEQALAAWQEIAERRCAIRRAAALTDRYLDRSRDESLRKDDCGIATLRAAALLERLGRAAEAATTYESAPENGAGDRNAARALAEAARLRDHLADPDRARADSTRCIAAWPDEVAAGDAVDRLLRIERAHKSDLGALRDRLDQQSRELARTDVAPHLLFAAADLSDHDLSDPEGAIARWDDLARRFPHSGLFDDSLWRAAALLRHRGDSHGALARLTLILQTRRRALITGSYNSVWLDDSQLLAGEIALDDLHDPKRAARYFEKLADDFTESTLRDDALFDLSRARLAEGNPAAACAALARLLTQFPDGNKVRATRAEWSRLTCPRD